MFEDEYKPTSGTLKDPPKLLFTGKALLDHFFKALNNFNNDSLTYDISELVDEKGKKRLKKLYENQNYEDTLDNLGLERLDHIYFLLFFTSVVLTNYEKSITPEEKAQQPASTTSA